MPEERRDEPMSGAMAMAANGFRALDRVLPRQPVIDRAIQRVRFRRAHGRFPRPSSHPQATFNDLIFERMARDSWTLLERVCIDKQYAKLIATALCPRVRSPATIAVLPMPKQGDAPGLARCLHSRSGRREVAKPTHASGTVLFLSTNPSLDAVEAFCRKASRSFYDVSRESQYRGLERKIILEEDLSRGGSAPTDYKFFCARGDVLFCQVDVGRFRNHLRTLTTPAFEPIPVRYAHDLPTEPPAKPSNFDEMLLIAKELSYNFEFVRIDLYSAAGAAYFGEFTFAPEGGVGSLSSEAFGISVMNKIRAARQRVEKAA